jgi:hypothetical protein
LDCGGKDVVVDIVRGAGCFDDQFGRSHAERAGKVWQQRQGRVLSAAFEVGHAGPAESDAFGEFCLGDRSSFTQAANGCSEVGHEVARHATTVTYRGPRVNVADIGGQGSTHRYVNDNDIMR